MKRHLQLLYAKTLSLPVAGTLARVALEFFRTVTGHNSRVTREQFELLLLSVAALRTEVHRLARMVEANSERQADSAPHRH